MRLAAGPTCRDFQGSPGFRSEADDEVGCWKGLGEGMGLASSEVEAVSVASGSCHCPQRGGQAVNLGVRAGRLGMVLDEAVDDSTSG